MDNIEEDKIVQFGDYIALYSECSLGYLAVNSSSELNNEPFVYANQSYDLPECVDSMSMLLFEVCLVHRYKMNKRYRKMLESDEGKAEEMESVEKLRKMKEAAALESRDNEQVMKRNFGRKLRFGDVIQLRHVFSGYFVHINSNQLSEIQKSAFKTMLQPYSAKSAQFMVVPKYKVDLEGSEVSVGAYIALESLASRSYYFHTNENPMYPPTTMKPGLSELNVSLEKHGFIVYKSKMKPQITDGFLCGMDLIHFFHQEAEAYVTAEGYYNGPVTEKLHMRVRKIDLLDIRTLTPSTNSNTYWEIEKANEPFSTDPISWNEPVRIKHGSTRLYISLNSKSQLFLTGNIHDNFTVFKFYPVNKDKEIYIRKGMNVRVENVRSNIWLKALPNRPYIKLENSKSSRFPNVVEWDNAVLLNITMNEHQQYDDAFNIEEVAPTNKDIFYKLSGFMSVILKLQSTITDHSLVTDESLINFFSLVLKEINNFICPGANKPIKNRQKLMRCTKMIDILFNVIESYGKLSMSSQQRWRRPFKLLFQLVSSYIGTNKKNTEYIGRYFPLFTESSWKTSPLVTEVISVLTLMVSSSAALADQVQQAHIQSVLQLARENSQPVFLRFLAQTCVSNDVPIISNQDFMIDEWLIRDKTGLYLIKHADDINFQTDEYYISKNLGQTWITIKDFYNPKFRNYNEESCQFLLAQLDFFNALTFGRNMKGIQIIIEQEKYITWPMVLSCLRNNDLSDDFRARLCKLVFNLFMSHGPNFSILSYPKYNYNYVDIDNEEEQKQKVIKPTKLDDSMLDIYDWMLRFIVQNACVACDSLPRNRLLLEVMGLIQNLIHYGYYDNAQSLMVLVTPILNFLDGRNDIKFSFNTRHGLTKQERDEQYYYRIEGRFELMTEANRVVMDAKVAGLKVLEQILIFQLNHRTRKFIQLFKRSMEKIGSTKKNEVLFYETVFKNEFTIEYLKKFPEEYFEFKNLLNSCMYSQKFFSIDRVKEVMLDLSQYKYHALLHKSLFFLTNFFCSENKVFDTCQNVFIANMPQSEKWVDMTNDYVVKLEVLISDDWTNETIKEFTRIIKVINAYAVLPNSNQPNIIFQKIVYSSNLVPILLKVFEKETGQSKANSANKISPVYRKISKIRPENFTHVNSMYRETLECLCKLSNEMAGIQNILFNQLNLIISLGDLGNFHRKLNLLKSIFNDREDLVEHVPLDLIESCFMWLTHHVEYKAEIIDMILCLGRVQSTSKLVRENMIIIFKLIMKYWSSFGHCIECAIDEKLDILNKLDDTAEMLFFVRLVDLLACASELDLEFVESFCKSVLSIDDILTVLGKVDNLLVQRAFFKFFSNVYIRSESSSVQYEYITSDISIILKSDKYWHIIKSICDNNNKWIETIKKTTPDEMHDNLSAIRDADNIQSEVMKYYVWLMDGILPFLKENLRTRCTNLDDAGQNQMMIETVRSVHTSVHLLVPHLASFHQVKCVTNFLYSIVLSNYIRYETLEPTYLQIGISVTHSGNSDYSNIRRNILLQFHDEQELNYQFRRFINNCRQLHVGDNCVSAQINYPSVVPDIERIMKEKTKASEQYTTIDNVEELPLGSEFQELMTTFVKLEEERPEKRFANLKCILRHLQMPLPRMMSRPGMPAPKQAADQDFVNTMCFKILRAILYNEICRLPVNWPLYMHDDHIVGQLQFIRQIQITMCDIDIFESTLHHASRINSPVTMELFAFLKVLLFNSSTYVQETIFRFFIVSVTETFFFAIKEFLTIFENNIKALRRKTNTSLKDKHKEATQFIVRRNTLTNLDLAMYHECKDYFENELSNKMLVLDNVTPLKFDTMIENGFGILLMKVLQSLCEGQFVKLQNYMRVQEDNPKSFNLVFRTCSMISCVYAHINDVTIDITTQIFGAINQMTIGNQENRLTLINGKVVDYINSIIRTTEFKDCTPTQVLDLREIIVTLLLNLIEENGFEAKQMAREIMITLDKKSIMNIIKHYYQLSKPDVIPDLNSLITYIPEKTDTKSKLARFTRKLTYLPIIRGRQLKRNAAIKERIFSIGYQYTAVLLRFIDLDSNYMSPFVTFNKDQIGPSSRSITGSSFDQSGSKKNRSGTSNVVIEDITANHVNAFKNFKRAGRSIELIKDDTLQRVHFRVKNPKVIREDLIETIKWDVDRTSNASKLRDFSDWCSSVIRDLEKTKKSSPLKTFLIQSWFLWNYLPIFLSLVINVLMLITFQSRYSLNSTNTYDERIHDPYPVLSPSPKLDTHMTYLAVIHTVLSLTLLVTYFLIAKPTFDNIRNAFLHFKHLFQRIPASDVITQNHNMNRLKKARQKIDMMREEERADAIIDYQKLKKFIENSTDATNETNNENLDMLDDLSEQTGTITNPQSPTSSSSPSTTTALYSSSSSSLKKNFSNKLQCNFFSFKTFYYIIFFLCSLFGTIFGGILYKVTNEDRYMIAYYLFAFHMINIALIVTDLKGVFVAVRQSLPSMAWVGFLILVIIYAFNIILFVMFRDSTPMDKNLYVDTLGHSYLTLIRFGFIFDKWFELFLPQFDEKKNFVDYLYLSIFTVALFIIVAIIMLNIIAGIIVDKFATTRNLKNSKFDDMNNLCFICGRSSYEFETMAKGFRYHIMAEHNMWAYLYYLLSLETMKIADFSSLQWHVHKMFQKKNLDFFPSDRAMALSETVKETDEQKLDAANEMLEEIVTEIENIKTMRAIRAGQNKLDMWRRDSHDNLLQGDIKRKSGVTRRHTQPYTRRSVGEMYLQPSSRPGEMLLDAARGYDSTFTDSMNMFTPSTNINTIPVNLISFDNGNRPESRISKSDSSDEDEINNENE